MKIDMMTFSREEEMLADIIRYAWYTERSAYAELKRPWDINFWLRHRGYPEAVDGVIDIPDEDFTAMVLQYGGKRK